MMTDLRGLPTPVLERLAAVTAEDRPGEGVRAGLDVMRGGNVLSARQFKVATRSDDDGTVTVDGYATVYDYPYDVAGGPPYGWSETIAAGAAKKSVDERDNVGLLVNHDSDTAFGLPLAATWADTLELESDRHGLRMSARIQPGDAVSDFLIRRLDRREADAMSFAFRVIRQEWDEDYTHRIISELALVDVSIVNCPANPATVAQLRTDRLAASAARRAPLARYRAEADRLRLNMF